MYPSPRAFRAKLSEELPKWANEGLITAEAADLLRQRYRLDEDGGAYAALGIYMLGAMLIGGGLISIVAWNWAFLPDALKLAGGVFLLIAIQSMGYFLWRIDRRWPRLGQSLVFLGLLAFGANVGLVGQVFHLSGHWYEGFGAWSLAAVALAFATRSLPCAAAAATLAVVWAIGATESQPDLRMMIAYGTTVAVGLLAAWFRHPLILAIGALGLSALLVAAGLRTSDSVIQNTGIFFAPLAVASALLTASLTEGWASVTARRLGTGIFIGFAYLPSFSGLANELRIGLGGARESADLAWLLLPPLGAATAGLLLRWRHPRPLHPAERSAATALVGIGLLFAASVFGGGDAVTLAAHLGLLAFVAVAIWRALDGLERGPFWLGLTVGGLVIVSRFLEYTTGLWFKGIVFTALGILVIVVGYVFESRRREVVGHAA